MRKRPFAEWWISQGIGAERGAALYGDLEELAQTRGRLWFWTAYFRALFSLNSWRTGLSAFYIAIVCRRYIVGPALWYLMSHRVTHLSEAGLFGMVNQHVAIRRLCWNISMVVCEFMIFMLPFVIVRFGLRDRLTQLACVLFAVAMPAYTLRPWFMDLSGVLTLAVMGAAVAIPAWRRAVLILAATFLTASAIVTGWLYMLVGVFHRPFLLAAVDRKPMLDAIAFAIAAMVSIYLHRRMLDSRPMVPRAPKPMKTACLP